MKTNLDTLTREELLQIIKEETKGKLFSVSFIKKDGSERKLVVRNRIKNFFHGGKNTTSHMPNYLNLFDMKDITFKKVNLDTIFEFVFNHKKYKII